jgi:hypothetical protein
MDGFETRLAESEKRLRGITVQSDAKGNYMELDGVLVCWGTAELKPSWPKSPHSRDFNFEFPRAFAGKPAITTGFDESTTTNVYGVYHSSLTESGFTGSVYDNKAQPGNNFDWSTHRVAMSYIAIGKAKTQAAGK